MTSAGIATDPSRDPSAPTDSPSLRAALVLPALALLLALPAAGQNCQTAWSDQSTDVSPFARSGASAVYDSLRGRIVLFGGGGGPAYFDDTWVRSGASWLPLPVPGPGARTEHAMAYDAARDRVVLFGGEAPGALLDDLWEFDGASWLQIPPSALPSPSARRNAMIAYQSARGRCLLYGGEGLGGALLDDAWEWDGAQWSPVPPGPGPGPLADAAMTYDAARERALLFGGRGPGGFSSATWQFDGTHWSEVISAAPDATIPAPRAGAAMIYEPECERVVLVGGLGAGGALDDTWELYGDDWLLRDVGGPSARSGAAAAYGGAEQRLVLHGGADALGPSGETWNRAHEPRLPIQSYDDDTRFLPEPDAACYTQLNCVSDIDGRLTSFIPTNQTPIKYVRIAFHVFQRSDGTGNWQNCASDIADLTQLTQWMNNYLGMCCGCINSDPCPGFTYLADTQVRVCLTGIYFYQDTALWNTSNTGALLSTAFAANPQSRDSVPILWTGEPFGGGGYAVLPGADHNADQFIVMPNNSTSLCNGLYTAYAKSSTLTHELGHVLSLLHMYQPSCCPEVTCNPADCEYLYDTFCPPVNPCYMDGGWNCNPWLPPTFNSCTNNMMDGTSSACFFTPTQMGKIHRALSTLTANRYQKVTDCLKPPANLTLWLAFNEPTTFGAAGNAAGGNAGAYNNLAFSDVVPGKSGNALRFNGSNQWVDVPTYPAVNVATGDFSIECWVRRPSGAGLDGFRVIVDKRVETPVIRGYAFFLTDGVLSLQLANGIGTQITNYFAGSPGGLGWIPDDGNWHHAGVTVKRNSATGIHFYRDGQAFPNAFDPTPRIGPLVSTAPLRVGAATAAPAGGLVFNGAIDEVEMYGRELLGSEMQAIYNAQGAGKCSRYCTVPWDAPFCLNDASKTVTAQICNATAFPQTFMYWFRGLPAVLTGCTVDGPTLFTPCSGMVTVLPGQCVPVTVSIARPAGWTAQGQTACYVLEVQSLGPNNPAKFECLGSVMDARDWCINVPGDVATLRVGIPRDLGPIMVRNTGSPVVQLNYRIRAIGPDMEPDQTALSLNGLPPGEPVIDTLLVPPGGTGEIELAAMFTEFQALRFYTILIEADVNGDGVPEPLQSFTVRNEIPPVRLGDANCDGAVDNGDIDAFVLALLDRNAYNAAFPACTIDNADANGDGTVDNGDIDAFVALLLG